MLSHCNFRPLQPSPTTPCHTGRTGNHYHWLLEFSTQLLKLHLGKPESKILESMEATCAASTRTSLIALRHIFKSPHMPGGKRMTTTIFPPHLPVPLQRNIVAINVQSMKFVDGFGRFPVHVWRALERGQEGSQDTDILNDSQSSATTPNILLQDSMVDLDSSPGKIHFQPHLPHGVIVRTQLSPTTLSFISVALLPLMLFFTKKNPSKVGQQPFPLYLNHLPLKLFHPISFMTGVP